MDEDEEEKIECNIYIPYLVDYQGARIWMCKKSWNFSFIGYKNDTRTWFVV